jgi:hypothetical protein
MRVVALNKGEQMLLWGLGASLLSHVISFLGVGYSDQIVVVWYLFLGLLSSVLAAAVAVSAPVVSEPVPQKSVTATVQFST